MPVTIHITVEDVATKLLTYTSIQLEQADSVSGSYSQIALIALVAGTYHYSHEDGSGHLNKWYRYRFTGAGGGSPQSAYSNPFRPEGATRLKIRQYALSKYNAGLVFLADSGGSASTIHTNDPKVRTSVFRVGRGKGGWLLPTTGLRAGEGRYISDSNPTAGTFTVSPNLSGAVAPNDEIEWHWLAEPSIWDDAINRGLRRYWYLERVPLVGSGTTEISLAALTWLKGKYPVTGLWWYPAGGGVEEPFAAGGRWWQIRQDADGLVLMTSPTLTSSDTVYLEALRQMPELWTDASATPAVCSLELASALAYDEVLGALTRPGTGASEDIERWRRERYEHAMNELRILLRQYRPRPRHAPPVGESPPVVPRPWRAR